MNHLGIPVMEEESAGTPLCGPDAELGLLATDRAPDAGGSADPAGESAVVEQFPPE
jgi:hypothetical protein